MSHNANQVLLGTTRSNVKDVGCRKGLIEAGLAVRQKSDGTITTVKADGALLGISLGKDLSDAGYTSMAYRGTQVPIQLAASFTPVVGAIVYIDDATGKAKASATDATAVNAYYNTTLLTDGAISENGSSTVAAAIIDFPGGL